MWTEEPSRYEHYRSLVFFHIFFSLHAFLLLFLAPFHCLDMDIIGYVFICYCSSEIFMAAFRLFRLLFLWFWIPPVHKFSGFHHDMGIGLYHPPICVPCCVLFLKLFIFFLSFFVIILPCFHFLSGRVASFGCIVSSRHSHSINFHTQPHALSLPFTHTH